LNIGDMDR